MFEFTATAAQTSVRDRARTFAASTLSADADRLDVEGGFPREALRRAAELGLLGINIPETLGGLGAGVLAYSLAVTELARVCAATTVAVCVSNMVAEVITHFGSSEQQRAYVPALCRGELCVGAFALSESGAGSDPAGMQTRARRTDTGWVLEGSKLWITSGTDAGLFVVWARTSDAAGARGISTFLVPGDTPGLVRGRPEHKLGLNGSTTTALEFHGCELPADALLDEEGRGFRIAMMALDGGRIGIASQALGIGQSALEAARQIAIARGVDVGSQQGLAWLLADSGLELEAARLMTLRAAMLKEGKRAFSREASMAKLYASERAVASCSRALDVAGTDPHPLAATIERNFRDARVTMIYEGTSEIQRVVIARDIMTRFRSK